jgi:hypothetical protein
MNRYRFLPTLTLLSLSTLALGAVGCSNGQSPTEPAALDTPVAAKSLAASSSLDKRHGADDPAGDDNGGRRNGGQDNGGQQRPQRGGAQAEGAVTAVDAAGGTLILAGGQRIAVNGQTQWNARGDLFTLKQVAAAVAAGKATRAEARGSRQASGVLLAQTIKAEVDGR